MSLDSAQAAAPSGAILLNDLVQIRERVKSGRISWSGPLLLVGARSVLLLASQTLMALVLLAAHRPNPRRAAGDWWNIYGTLVDVGCLIGLRYFTRREGIRLRDLLGQVRLRRGRDVFLGLGYFLLAFPFFLGASYGAQLLLFRSAQQSPYTYLVHVHSLPLWATVYSLTLWWMLWSPTEEATYQAYVLPRLEVLSGRTWIALFTVGFCWAAQHCFLPFVPDWKFLLFRFLGFLPGVFILMLLYLRTRRLAPLVIAHWPMDIVAAVMTAAIH